MGPVPTTGNRLGRRTELIIAAALYGTAAFMTGAAPNLSILLAGRIMYGLAIGFAMHAAPAYISETAPPNVRGLLVSMKEVFIVGGILLAYLVDYAYADTVGAWRNIFAMVVPLSVVLGLGMVSTDSLLGMHIGF